MKLFLGEGGRVHDLSMRFVLSLSSQDDQDSGFGIQLCSWQVLDARRICRKVEIVDLDPDFEKIQLGNLPDFHT